MSDDYDIGYRKPPEHTRFQKGKSGNPNGRPKRRGDDAAAMMERILAEKITVHEGGRSRQISKLEAILRTQVGRACKGDDKAWQAITRLLDQGGPSSGGSNPSGVLIVPGVSSLEDWEKIAEAHQSRFCGNTGD